MYKRKSIIVIALAITAVCLFLLSQAAMYTKGFVLEGNLNSVNMGDIEKESNKCFGSAYKINKLTMMEDARGDEKYVLVEYNPMGFMVYSMITGEYVEYSEEAMSPYITAKGKPVYIGPGSRLYRVKNNIYGVGENAPLSNVQKEDLMAASDAFIMAAKNSLNDITYSDAIDEQSLSTGSVNNSTASVNTTSYWVEYPWYFRRLINNMPFNNNGSCSYIAAGSLLMYFDSCYNDNFVNENDELREINNCTNLANISASTGYFWDTVDDLYYALYGSYPGDSAEFGANMAQVQTMLNNYLSSKGLSSYCTVYYSGGNSTTAIRAAIQAGYPVIVGFNGDWQGTGNIGSHACVVYGYENGGFIANMGATGMTYHATHNIKNYTVDSFCYINYNKSVHVHSNNHHLGDIANMQFAPHMAKCTCGQQLYHQPVVDDDYGDGIYHLASCDCSFFPYLLPHTAGSLSQHTATNHRAVCTGCAAVYYPSHIFSLQNTSETQHRLYCPCGYSSYQNHSYSPYAYYNVATHTKSCICAKIVSENHNYVDNGNYEYICTGCGHVIYMTK